VSEAIAEQVAKVLDLHQMRDDGLTGLVCGCGQWRLVYREINYPDPRHKAHVAGQVQRVVDARCAEVWGDGYLRGTLDTTSDLEPADNPYRDAEEGA
jgi:hypothetical protein